MFFIPFELLESETEQLWERIPLFLEAEYNNPQHIEEKEQDDSESGVIILDI